MEILKSRYPVAYALNYSTIRYTNLEVIFFLIGMLFRLLS